MIRKRPLAAVLVLGGLLALAWTAVAMAGNPAGAPKKAPPSTTSTPAAKPPPRSANAGHILPLTRQSVFNYFATIEGVRSSLPKELPPDAREDRLCHLYADVLEKDGYSFEETVQNAVQLADRGANRLSDPRFLFLAGVFQIHPDVFMHVNLISAATRDAVVDYLSGKTAP